MLYHLGIGDVALRRQLFRYLEQQMIQSGIGDSLNLIKRFISSSFWDWTNCYCTSPSKLPIRIRRELGYPTQGYSGNRKELEALGYRTELGYQELECPGYREELEALGFRGELGYYKQDTARK